MVACHSASRRGTEQSEKFCVAAATACDVSVDGPVAWRTGLAASGAAIVEAGVSLLEPAVADGMSDIPAKSLLGQPPRETSSPVARPIEVASVRKPPDMCLSWKAWKNSPSW